MIRPTIRIHDFITNEVIDREMNDQEFAVYEADQAELATRQVEAGVRAEAKAALLAQLGITEEQARLLLS
jgi:hypothetical protein